MSEQLVDTYDDGSAHVILLNRPKKYNALNVPLFEQVSYALALADMDLKVKAAVLASGKKSEAGVITLHEKFLAAGADIEEMEPWGTADVKASDFIGQKWSAIQKFENKPIGAAVSGAALGGGLEQLLKCDYVVVSDRIKLGLPESTLGTIPGDGGIQRAFYKIGPLKTMMLVISGRMDIGAAEALEMGLIDEINEPGHDLLKLTTKRVLELADDPNFKKAFSKDHTPNFGMSYEKPNFDISFEELKAYALELMEQYPQNSRAAMELALEVGRLTLELPLKEALKDGKPLFYGTFDHSHFKWGREQFVATGRAPDYRQFAA